MTASLRRTALRGARKLAAEQRAQVQTMRRTGEADEEDGISQRTEVVTMAKRNLQVVPKPEPEKPRDLTESQLKWLRKNMPHFAQANADVLAVRAEEAANRAQQ